MPFHMMILSEFPDFIFSSTQVHIMNGDNALTLTKLNTMLLRNAGLTSICSILSKFNPLRRNDLVPRAVVQPIADLYSNSDQL